VSDTVFPILAREGGDGMPRFRIQDFWYLEKSPTSPHSMKNKISDLIYCSTWSKAKVDSVNPETGEYRVYLTGTLEKEDTKWDES
jgi:hypothetical protein